jgi:hypothetical protein
MWNSYTAHAETRRITAEGAMPKLLRCTDGHGGIGTWSDLGRGGERVRRPLGDGLAEPESRAIEELQRSGVAELL